ncbi:hypothetical protein C1N79_11325 [Streptomyces sp. SGAir0924]|nr:hypothetical protein DBP22_09010 [Streptomyces sp. CS207]QCR47238.1 hypothetical protein C1N79_11325 [Streptomyces sp. SGAir0924]
MRFADRNAGGAVVRREITGSVPAGSPEWPDRTGGLYAAGRAGGPIEVRNAYETVLWCDARVRGRLPPYRRQAA